jgi:hypothetical protein
MKINPWPEVRFCGRLDRPVKLFVYKYGTYLTDQKNERLNTAVFSYGLWQPIYKFVPRGMIFDVSRSKETWNLQQDRFAWLLCLRLDILLDGLSNLCRSKISPIWRGFAVLQSAVRGWCF